MNSLQDLNTFGQTSLDIPDERASQVIFDRVAPLQPLDTTDQITSTTVPVDPGIEIIEIVNYATANVRYRVIIQTSGSPALSGSTVSWASIPSGLTLTTAGNTYTISGITTLAHWAAIKSFTWSLPVNYASCPNWYLDVAVIYYNSELDEDVVVDWEVYDPDNYYIALLSSQVTMVPNILRIKSSAVSMSAASSLSAQVGEVFFGEISATSTATVSAEGTTNPTNLTSAFALGCQINYIVRPTLTLASQTGFLGYNTTYIDLPRTTESYSLNTTAAISGGPLITDALQDGSGTYTMTVYPIPSTAVSSMTSAGRWSPVATQTLTKPFTSTTWQAGAISNDGEYMIAGANYASSYQNGYALLYQKIGGQYIYYNNFSPLTLKFDAIQPTGVSGSAAGFAHRISSGSSALSNGAEYVALATGTETGTYHSYVYIFKRTGTSFTQQAAVFGNYDANWLGDLSFDNAGTMLVCGDMGQYGVPSGHYGGVEIYRRSGTSWASEQTIQPAELVYYGSNGQGSGFFGAAVSASGDGTRIAIGAHYQGNITSFSPITVSDVKWGAVYIYVYSAGTWSLEQRIVPADSTTNNQFGSIVKLNSDGTRLVAKSTTGIYVYTRSGSTWTLESKAATYYGTTMSPNSNITYGYDEITVTASETASYNVLTQFGTSWNSAAKTLTLTGTRSQVNTDIDTIQLTPATGYTSNFDLRYTVTTPRNRTDSRDQDVDYT